MTADARVEAIVDLLFQHQVMNCSKTKGLRIVRAALEAAEAAAWQPTEAVIQTIVVKIMNERAGLDRMNLAEWKAFLRDAGVKR